MSENASEIELNFDLMLVQQNSLGALPRSGFSHSQCVPSMTLPTQRFLA